MGDESVPKIITNDTINLFFNCISLISNRNSFRVLFDEIASVHFIWKNIFIFWHWKWSAQGTSTVSILLAPFRSLFIGWSDGTESMVTKLSPFCGYNLWSYGFRSWPLPWSCGFRGLGLGLMVSGLGLGFVRESVSIWLSCRNDTSIEVLELFWLTMASGLVYAPRCSHCRE